jgi:hypothetical protein
MAEPTSKAEVRKRFSKQIDANVTTGKETAKSIQNQQQLAQHVVDKNEWSGDLFDLKGIASAFDRKENAEDMQKITADAGESGVAGDLIATVLQADYLAVQERAFRARHMTRVRATIHRAGRNYGQGHNAGVFKQGVLGHVTGVLKQSKEA